MKQTLILVLSVMFFGACLGGSSSTRNGDVEGPKRGENKTFAEHYEELEEQPVPTREQVKAMPNNLQTEDERAADVAWEAQAERRGAAPLIESNYIFKVKQDKSVYSYDQHNQVWKDERSAREYKETKRLWEKPKRYAANKYYGESSSEEDVSYED